jgi:hypothetical protein
LSGVIAVEKQHMSAFLLLVIFYDSAYFLNGICPTLSNTRQILSSHG